MLIKKLLARGRPEPRIARVPSGERVYAIGDVHGRRDCLEGLLRAIEADDLARGSARSTVIFLGDLVDRGPDSRGVIDTAMAIADRRRCIFLMGNHEEILIHSWEGDPRAAGLFQRIGGRETLMSYGVPADCCDRFDSVGVAEATAAHVPARHIAFLRSFEDSVTIGDYHFVHAGIRPGIALDAQSPADLRWIRRDFLDDTRDHGAMIVHGHSITETPDQRPNRIGIDTGAFASGTLTAVGIQGAARWFLTN